MKLLLCLFLLLAASMISVNAQNDYVVTLVRDTLHGNVGIHTDKLFDRVHIQGEDQKKKFLLANQVLAVSYKGEMYRPIKFLSKLMFMQVLQDGYLTLFGYRIENQVTYEGRLLVKRDGSLMEVPNISYKKLMVNFLNDCPTIAKEVNAGAWPKNQLTELIDNYNKCMENTSMGDLLIVKGDAKKIEAVIQFNKKIESLAFNDKEPVLELIDDIQQKVEANKSVPQYQLDALSNYLRDQREVRSDLEKLIKQLKS